MPTSYLIDLDDVQAELTRAYNFHAKGSASRWLPSTFRVGRDVYSAYVASIQSNLRLVDTHNEPNDRKEPDHGGYAPIKFRSIRFILDHSLAPNEVVVE